MCDAPEGAVFLRNLVVKLSYYEFNAILEHCHSFVKFTVCICLVNLCQYCVNIMPLSRSRLKGKGPTHVEWEEADDWTIAYQA